MVLSKPVTEVSGEPRLSKAFTLGASRKASALGSCVQGKAGFEEKWLRVKRAGRKSDSLTLLGRQHLGTCSWSPVWGAPIRS